MATISQVNLEITEVLGGSQFEVTVKYSLQGSAFDIASLQPYKEICKLVGDDEVFAEDGFDDFISELTPSPNNPPVVFSDFAPIQRVFTRMISRVTLNEDSPNQGLDEIQAIVTLTPILPVEVKRQSNVKLINA